MNEIESTILAFVSELTDDDGTVPNLGPTGDLIGILDSIDTVRLILFIEQRFKVDIAEEDIDDTLFASLSSLAAYVDAKLTAS